MSEYLFYYDESEHSRKINFDTVNAENYYDNFASVIVGWKEEYEAEIFQKYALFEEKYADRKSKGELKSHTLKQSQFQNGFASLNKSNVCFVDDFLSIFNNKIYVYLSVKSKIEFIVSQLLEGYKNSFIYDMDAMKYSIIKSILMYQPPQIIETVFKNTGEFCNALKSFYKDRIEKNQENTKLKFKETETFTQILMILEDIEDIKTIEWSYDTAFIGFKYYLDEISVNDYLISIDREGENGNTINAAKRTGIENVTDVDSKDSIGVRISDMLVGLISKLLKALYGAFKYTSPDGSPQKMLLNKEWFMLNQNQLELYKKLHYILCEPSKALYKVFSGIYRDDLISLISLLDYMEQFDSIEELNEQNIDMQGEYFNSYSIQHLAEYFSKLQHKLPIEPIPNSAEDYYFNNRGAKIYFNIKKQPMLKFSNGTRKCNVLSVGIDRNGVPLVTIEEQEAVNCYRLPNDLSEWAMTLIGFANMGINMFPAEVIFSELNGKHYADIL